MRQVIVDEQSVESATFGDLSGVSNASQLTGQWTTVLYAADEWALPA